MTTPKQFDVCRVLGLRAGSPVELAVVMQDDALSHLATRIVAPLVPVDPGLTVDRVTPTVAVEGVQYAVAVHLLMTIPVRNLGARVASIEGNERVLKAAIDMVFFGV